MASAGFAAMRCSRCHATTHSTADCHRPFLRTHTIAEERILKAKTRAEKEASQKEKQAKWEAQKAENARKQSEWEKRTAQKKDHQASWDSESCCTEGTVSTAVSTGPSEEEVMEIALMSKDVRKLTKVLRDISRLEALDKLDDLQRVKLARKQEFEVELETALGLAKAKARNELRNRNKA